MRQITENKRLLKWILFGLLFKLGVYLLFINALHSHWAPERIVKSICFIDNDTKSYYEPIERFINGEGYSYQSYNPNNPKEPMIVPMAYRLPGLLPIYGPLYYFFGSEWAQFLVILFQFFAELISVYLLARTAEILFPKIKLFGLVFILYLINAVASVYTLYAYSESFCISFLIFSLYFLARFSSQKHLKYLFLAGLFLCWSIFFRPVIIIFVPFHILLLLYFLAQEKKLTLSYVIRPLIVFFSVFILSESIWVIRNFKVFNRFIPLYSGLDSYNSREEMSLFKLIIAWGGDIQDWNPAEGRWFVIPSNSQTRVYDESFQATNPFRESVFTPDYNYDSLVVLRNDYWKALGYSVTNDSIDREAAFKNFSMKVDRYYASFKKHHPLDFYLVSRIRHLKTFLLIKRPYAFPFNGKSTIHKALRACSLLFYYFILVVGFLGMVVSLIKKNKAASILAVSALTFLFIHAYLGLTEFRYSLPAYPIFTLFASVASCGILTRFRLLPGSRKQAPLTNNHI